jgi:ABC-type Fe3+/spermidine/putrescine transport system ATPase subunit
MEIKLDAISKVYEASTEESPALANISVRIASGEFFFLLGPSGCGKTTLLRLIAGLLKPTAGHIYFDDRDVTALPVDRRDTAMVFQGYALWPHMTVLENVEFGPRMRGGGRDERRGLAMDQLRRVQMDSLAGRKPNQLSGGQQQRVAVARALAAGTRCLLLDEPLSNLDARLRLHMRDELRTLVKRSGMTAVYVTHDQKEALSMADRIAVMNAGHIVQVGTPEELYNRPATRFVADFLGEANFLDGDLSTGGLVTTAIGEIRHGHAGDLAPGQAVTCCIRPERIVIEAGNAAKAADDENLVAATIVSNIYLGEIRQFTCRLDGAQDIVWRVSMLAHESPEVREGDSVRLRFAAEHCVLVGR